MVNKNEKKYKLLFLFFHIILLGILHALISLKKLPRGDEHCFVKKRFSTSYYFVSLK